MKILAFNPYNLYDKKVERGVEMKTIKEIANAVNISKTSVYNLIKRNNIQTFKKDGTTYLDEKAETLIIAYYSGERHETIKDILADTKTEERQDFQESFQDSKLNEYRHYIGILEKELDEKNKTIQGLIQAMTAEKINDAARLMLQDKNHAAPISDTDEPPKGFFNRIFRKK